ncbi:uncharacterized protein [Drosophila bipectinata]|uniref:uncharacterized protein isoform X3 n=1 Tax=Drosophila bipectinata TaxID=42026 RepID=UPI0038B2DFC9
MDGWLILLYNLLLLYVPVPGRSSGPDVQRNKNTNGDRQTSCLVQNLDDPAHVQRLYDAYRVRFKGDGDWGIGGGSEVSESKDVAELRRENRHPVLWKMKEPLDKEKPSYAFQIIQYDSNPVEKTSDHKDAKSSDSPSKLKALIESVEKLKEPAAKNKSATHNSGVKSDSSNNAHVPLGKCILDFYTRSKEKKPASEKPITQTVEGPSDNGIKGLGEREKGPVCLPAVKYENTVILGNGLNNLPNLKKSNNNPAQANEKMKEPSCKEKPPISIKYDFTDDRPSCIAKCPSRPPNVKGINEKSSHVVVLKLDIPGDVPPQEREPPKDSGDRRILELSRIYNEILRAWQRPSQMFSAKKTRPDSTSSTVKLSALSDLLDVVEQLERTDLVSELAGKIGEKLEPNLDKKILHDNHLVKESRASLTAISKNDLTGLFENMEPGSAVIAFKKVLADVKSRSSSIRAGGLYDEYKKGFCQLFNEHKFPRQSLLAFEADNLLDSDLSQNLNDSSQCLVGDKKEEKAPSRNINYLKAMDNFVKLNRESNQNGGLKPYFLPNSKSRQLVWNEVPLIKPGFSDKKVQKIKPPDAPIQGKGDVEKEKEEKPLQQKPLQKDDIKTEEPLKKTETKIENPDPKQEIKWDEDIATKTKPKSDDSSSMSANKLLASKMNPWPDLSSSIDPDKIVTGMKAIKHSNFFNLFDEYESQMDNLHKALKTKQSWWKEVIDKAKTPKTNTKRNSLTRSEIGLPVPFPEVLVNQVPPPGVTNVLDNMATQMNLSPLEVAQRIVGNSPNLGGTPRLQPIQAANQIVLPKGPETLLTASYPQLCPPQGCQQLDQTGSPMSPILDKILERLETIQATKCNQTEEEVKKLPCCFVDPADGTPCDLNGSWESPVLGVRINIKSTLIETPMEEKKEIPTCFNPKKRKSREEIQRFLRTCVKMNRTQLKNLNELKNPTGIPLNISVQETVPPRPHELLDNITDWRFSGHALMIQGGPVSLSFRQMNSSLIGHFVGYCRTCGCVDTIFGSWTFCRPSRDCQDISMSIVDRRDMLRRYSMDERRKNRFKEQLYHRSKFAKMEKERMRDEQQKFPSPYSGSKL